MMRRKLIAYPQPIDPKAQKAYAYALRNFNKFSWRMVWMDFTSKYWSCRKHDVQQFFFHVIPPAYRTGTNLLLGLKAEVETQAELEADLSARINPFLNAVQTSPKLQVEIRAALEAPDKNTPLDPTFILFISQNLPGSVLSAKVAQRLFREVKSEHTSALIDIFRQRALFHPTILPALLKIVAADKHQITHLWNQLDEMLSDRAKNLMLRDFAYLASPDEFINVLEILADLISAEQKDVILTPEVFEQFFHPDQQGESTRELDIHQIVSIYYNIAITFSHCHSNKISRLLNRYLGTTNS